MTDSSHEHHSTSQAADASSAGHAGHDMGGVNRMAVSATLHCLTGCAIGEIAGLVIGTASGLSNASTLAVSIVLAFFFGYTLSTLPLVKSGLPVGTALKVVLAADTVSIGTMEIVDNLVMAVIPGAMNAGLVNVLFWVGMAISLAVAFVAAFPVNRFLLQRGKGHALTHDYHGRPAAGGARSRIPSLSTGALVAALLAFMLGGLVVSVADDLGASGGSHSPDATHPGATRAARP